LTTGVLSSISRLSPLLGSTLNSWPVFDLTTISLWPAASMPLALKPVVYWKSPVIGMRVGSPTEPSLPSATR
jgi:hypothetical protein